MFDVVGIGLNAIDYLVSLPRFPVPGASSRFAVILVEEESGGDG